MSVTTSCSSLAARKRVQKLHDILHIDHSLCSEHEGLLAVSDVGEHLTTHLGLVKRVRFRAVKNIVIDGSLDFGSCLAWMLD